MSIDRAQADAVASAVDLIATALGDGLDVDEAARLVVVDKRAAGIAIAMLTTALRDQIDDRARADGHDPAVYRAVFVRAMRFETMAQLVDVPDSYPRRRLRFRRK